jgi:hypothetical protein
MGWGIIDPIGFDAAELCSETGQPSEAMLSFKHFHQSGHAS